MTRPGNQQHFFVESFVFVIMVQTEFSPANCPLSPITPFYFGSFRHRRLVEQYLM